MLAEEQRCGKTLPVVVVDPGEDVVHDPATQGARVSGEGAHRGQHGEQLICLQFRQHDFNQL